MVFLSEEDRVGHRRLQDLLLARARELGLAGATIWRGIDGFGRSRRVRSARFPDADAGLPIVVEVIDSAEATERFLEVVRELAPGSFVTREPVWLARPGAAPKRAGGA
jgi:PII-like signaling protein